MPNPPPHTLENLIHYKPGYDPRRNNVGRPKAGLTLEEAYNELEDREKYPIERLEEISKTHKSGSWRASADLWLRLHANGAVFAKNGQPVALHDLEHLHDRTVGRPTQRVDVVRTEIKDPRGLMVELAKVMASDPGMAKALGVQLGGVLEESADAGGGAPKEA